MSLMNDITFIANESVEMFEELVGISDDELHTMEQLLTEVRSLVRLSRRLSRGYIHSR